MPNTQCAIFGININNFSSQINIKIKFKKTIILFDFSLHVYMIIDKFKKNNF